MLLAAACTGSTATGGDTTTTSESRGTTTTSVAVSSTTTESTTTTTLPLIQVSGNVFDPEGRPVAGVVVSWGASSAVTGDDGWFTLETTEPTELEASKPGWTSTVAKWVPDSTHMEIEIAPVRMRGLRVDAETAGNDAAFEALLDLAGDTAINALVFDTKQEGGNVLYETDVRDAHDIGAVTIRYEPQRRIAQARQHGLYLVTRIVTFEDAIRARERPEERLAGVWLDPRSAQARRYNIDLAVEACEMGFDEVQFDYVRFPSGRTAAISGQLSMSQEERVDAIASFLSEARAALEALDCAVSAAVFAIVVSVPDDQGLGQRPEELSRHVDFLSPMVYPSHYSPGWLGFPDPNDFPGEVTADAISDALPRLSDQARLRPWLQAFWWSDAEIREAIEAAEEADVGWILWNVRSNYGREALPASDEVDR